GRGSVNWDNWRHALTSDLQQRGLAIEVGGHGYQNFINADMPAPGTHGKTLFEVHPEWFAEDENGHRRREHNWVFNTANPQAVQFLVGTLIDYGKARPEIQIFDLWPPDGEHWDQSTHGKMQGTPTDRMVMLTNQVRGELARVCPDVRLECIAYNRYTKPPQSQQLQKNVLVDFCPISQSFQVPLDDLSNARNAQYVHDLLGWRHNFAGNISLYSYYCKYAWRSLPVLLPHYLQQDLQFLHAVPLQGVSIYSEPGNWFTFEVNHYVLAKLAWDPHVNITALLREFAQARYGPACNAAIEAFDILEKTVRNFCSIPFTDLQEPQALHLAREQIHRAETELATWLGNAAIKDEAIKLNLARLVLDCQYAQKDIELQAMRAEHAPDTHLAQAVRSLHKFLVEHGDEGLFLVQDHRLSENALRTHYGLKPSNSGQHQT
ncbi:MAG TPA: DUF4838 domain-containing protein, partial [Tepidisphaeraceae bacterium]|nr:DUF4838 domain-containing protein [Tepidisphaeraceae bacterium]